MRDILTGKLAPKIDRRTLTLSDYVGSGLALPSACDWSPAVRHGLFESGWPLYGNDAIGDCTIAAAAHMIELWSANVGSEIVPSQADVLAGYKAVSGYDGTPETDGGCAELDVLNFWRQTGIAGTHINAFAAVDWNNADHVRAAILWFGGLYIGLVLPNSARAQLIWDDTPNDGGDWGAHAVNVVAYSPGMYDCITWGQKKRMTERFFRSRCDEAYAILYGPWVASSGVSPSGLNADQLQQDLADITDQ